MKNETASPVPYRERVLPSIGSLWPILLIVPTTTFTFAPFENQLGVWMGPGLGIFFSVAILVSIWFAAPIIEVDETGFSVGEAQLPLQFIGGYEIVPKERAFEERGYRLDPAACNQATRTGCSEAGGVRWRSFLVPSGG